MKDEALKPCPFCGGKAKSWANLHYMKSAVLFSAVGCDRARCGVRPFVEHVDHDHAVKVWNRRKP